MPLAQLLFGFEGRIRRSQLWLTSIGLGVVFGVVLAVLMMVMGVGLGAASHEPGVGLGIAGMFGRLIAVALWLVLMWINVALLVKRWHDRDRPGVFVLFSFVPLVNIWAAIELLFLDGTQGPNQFGPSPKGIGGTAQVFS